MSRWSEHQERALLAAEPREPDRPARLGPTPGLVGWLLVRRLRRGWARCLLIGAAVAVAGALVLLVRTPGPPALDASLARTAQVLALLSVAIGTGAVTHAGQRDLAAVRAAGVPWSEVALCVAIEALLLALVGLAAGALLVAAIVHGAARSPDPAAGPDAAMTLLATGPGWSDLAAAAWLVPVTAAAALLPTLVAGRRSPLERL